MQNLLLFLLFASALHHAGLTQEASASKPVRADHVTAQLISRVDAVSPGSPFQVALRFEIDPHWHTYYLNPGDSGLATSLHWDLPEGFSASPIQWPTPQRLPFGPLVNFGYEGTVLHVVTITPPDNLKPGEKVTLNVRADWLICEEICIPGSASLDLNLPVAATSRPSQWEADFSNFDTDRASAAENLRISAASLGSHVTLSLPGVTWSGGAAFFPDEEGWMDNTMDALVEQKGSIAQITLRVAENGTVPKQIEGLLVRLDGKEIVAGKSSLRVRTASETASTAAAQVGSLSFPAALGLGFLGGLILNLMPCVFPVLGLKIMGFVGQAGSSRVHVMAHGLTFTAGVLASFWLLAGVLLMLRAGGQELGWGFQLQSPGFVFALMIFLFAFALNLMGVFEFGVSAIGVGSSLTGTGSWKGSFFSGVLATVVATPCAAPFLAPALGAALALPPFQSIILFTAIALGLSAPYLILSFRPSWVACLPRPGAWMESFKQAMSFPLFATAAYLLWVLEAQVDEDMLRRIFFSLVGVSLALWIYGKWSAPHRPRNVRLSATLAAVLLALMTLVWSWPAVSSSTTDVSWEPWSKTREETLRSEGRMVYVDFTARWCATCQTNKAIVFSNTEVIQSFREKKIAALKADWTNQDPAITRELARFGRSAVPFNVIYRDGMDTPLILPELLTPQMVLDALNL
ncbi:MAG: protein-disulfide reductase DsbD family protein [Candidatus Methylacidiphilales bacterium]